MKRFTITRNDSVKVFAYNGRTLLASAYNSFSSVGECIAWAKLAAKGRTLTEIGIANETKETWASYNPNGKKI